MQNKIKIGSYVTYHLPNGQKSKIKVVVSINHTDNTATLSNGVVIPLKQLSWKPAQKPKNPGSN